MRNVVLAGLTLGLAGCPPESVTCGEFEEVFVWADGDGDGFGSEVSIGYTCAPGENEATNNVDCDDANADVNPAIAELCDIVDNDCDGVVDESLAFYPWFLDSDGDGYGDPEQKQTFCKQPGPEWISLSGDCADSDPSINPEALEVCDEGIDNDCDGQADDGDGSLDLASTIRWYIDADEDGYGGDEYFDQCLSPNLDAVTVGGDCNDASPQINPGELEVCNPNADENCNMLLDDEDPYIDPASQRTFFADADGDGYGDPYVIILACVATEGVGVENDLDCDDNDAEANEIQNWYVDEDGDGVGSFDQFAFTQCVRPTAGDCAAPNTCEPESNGDDCAPDDPTIFPGQWDPCEDGIDADCDTLDTYCKSCKHWQDTLGAALVVDGVYDIQPTISNLAKVWCDMTVDGGGWTLVGSSRDTTLNDAGTPDAYADMQTLNPTLEHKPIWMGMRHVVAAEGDIRFACKIAGSAVLDVDLSFYDNLWYMGISNGTDTQSCFNENDGVGADPPPARSNNVNGAYLPAGDQWGFGYLEGEDSCGDEQDFTVDFDDGGINGNGGDGTDWGESNGTLKCTGNNMGEAWFIFVREN